MINYHYKCQQESCSAEFETLQSIHDTALQECPSCGINSLQRVIHTARTLVKKEPRTLGLLAERNTMALSRQQREDMWAQQDQQKELAKAVAREELSKKLPAGASIPKI